MKNPEHINKLDIYPFLLLKLVGKVNVRPLVITLMVGLYNETIDIVKSVSYE
jgi:hypothetical protein